MKSISKKKDCIRGLCIIFENWEANEVAHNTHSSHGSHFKNRFKNIKKCWRKNTDNNMLNDIRDFYF